MKHRYNLCGSCNMGLSETYSHTLCPYVVCLCVSNTHANFHHPTQAAAGEQGSKSHGGYLAAPSAHWIDCTQAIIEIEKNRLLTSYHVYISQNQKWKNLELRGKNHNIILCL